jgi:hypothetical protein
MKAKIIKTGEIINIAEYAKIELDVCDSYGNPIQLKPDDIELIPDVKEDNLPKIDWEQRRYEIAREILPSIAENILNILQSGGSLGQEVAGKTVAEISAIDTLRYTDALIEELKKGGCK